jgi:tetratricopeptide (TPR) repeat protein
MPARVTWLGRASDRVRRDLVPLLSGELRALFPEAQTIGVYDCFSGYTDDPARRIVLGVEVRSRGSCRTHVIKLGAREAVAPDYEGWRRCVQPSLLRSRVFVPVRPGLLGRGRTAAIYEDASALFGSAQESQGAESLEAVALRAVNDGTPDPLSVERVIRQVCAELYRWLYRAPRADGAAAVRFYGRRLRRGMPRWSSEPWRRDLRRDLLWLLCSHEPRGADAACLWYLDPCDYVSWALAAGRVPQTLVGRSHGDLHGRNILVGVQRGEAEYPAVFDYGEMGERNVLVWDFVKLECELKVRLLLSLFDDPDSRAALLQFSGDGPSLPGMPGANGGGTVCGEAVRMRAQRLAFAFRFEHALAQITAQIHRLADAESRDPPGGRRSTGHAKLDRALALFARVRQEAALLLGDRQPHRGPRGQWRDEYLFALAVYGVASAKFDYKESEASFALVSAGVAAACCESARRDILAAIEAPPPRREPREGYPSYRVPLAHAHGLWRDRRRAADTGRALGILDEAVRRYPHAVPLLLEHALLLAEVGRHGEALRAIEPLEGLCRVFHDEETLSRAGRLCKDMGDRAMADMPVERRQLGRHPARQWYEGAFRRYREAFDIGRDFYPGINAATLALMLGREDEARTLAADVLDICGHGDLGAAGTEPRFWLLASQGEASLVLGREAEAAAFYRQALSALPPGHEGLAEASRAQVRRLAWALGKPLDRVMAVFGARRARRSGAPALSGRKTRRSQWKSERNC